jgi:hypothetical protein
MVCIFRGQDGWAGRQANTKQDGKDVEKMEGISTSILVTVCSPACFELCASPPSLSPTLQKNNNMRIVPNVLICNTYIKNQQKFFIETSKSKENLEYLYI